MIVVKVSHDQVVDALNTQFLKCSEYLGGRSGFSGVNEYRPTFWELNDHGVPITDIYKMDLEWKEHRGQANRRVFFARPC